MKRTNESGRSMIEMLGVLAVIGVLSVGGLLGYKTAMNTHYANETLSDLSKMSVWVSSQRMSDTAGNISSFKKTSPYEITLTDATDPNKKFVLTVANVPEAVCIKILGMNWDVPVITPATCSGTANMTFTFNNDLKKGNGEEEEVCSGVKCGSSCCPIDATCDPDHPNKCCIDLYAQGNLLCNYRPEELYCAQTDSNGDCSEWSFCDTFINSQDRILGVPNAMGACAYGSDTNIYCYTTNQNGQCNIWSSCDGAASLDIIGISNALGECGKERYCYHTNNAGECDEIRICNKTNSKFLIVGTPNAYGGCAYDGWEYVCCAQKDETNKCLTYGQSQTPCADGGIDCDCLI